MFYPNIILRRDQFVNTFLKIFFTFLKKLSTQELRQKCPSKKATKKMIFMVAIFYVLCFLTKIFADFRHYWIFTNRVFCGIILVAGGQSSIGFPLLHIGVWFLMKCQSYDVTQNRNKQRCAFLIFPDPSLLSQTDLFFFPSPTSPSKRGKKRDSSPTYPFKKSYFYNFAPPY